MIVVDFSEGGYPLTSMEYRKDAEEGDFSGLWVEGNSVRETTEHSGFAARFEGGPYVEVCKDDKEFSSIQELEEWLWDCKGRCIENRDCASG